VAAGSGSTASIGGGRAAKLLRGRQPRLKLSLECFHTAVCAGGAAVGLGKRQATAHQGLLGVCCVGLQSHPGVKPPSPLLTHTLSQENVQYSALGGRRVPLQICRLDGIHESAAQSSVVSRRKACLNLTTAIGRTQFCSVRAVPEAPLLPDTQPLADSSPCRCCHTHHSVSECQRITTMDDFPAQDAFHPCALQLHPI